MSGHFALFMGSEYDPCGGFGDLEFIGSIDECKAEAERRFAACEFERHVMWAHIADLKAGKMVLATNFRQDDADHWEMVSSKPGDPTMAGLFALFSGEDCYPKDGAHCLRLVGSMADCKAAAKTWFREHGHNWVHIADLGSLEICLEAREGERIRGEIVWEAP